jgi:uncharacterized membrane protein
VVYVEQMKREKVHAIVVAAIEVGLGFLVLYIGLQFFNIYNSLNQLLGPYTPSYFMDIRTIVLIGGIFVILHGIKRMVDNILNAWVKSAVPPEKQSS